MDYHILTINPGSTSTKVGFFRCDTPMFSANIQHSAQELSKFPKITDQLSYRTEVILNRLEQSGIDLGTADAFVGRGGGLLSVEGGTYVVDALLLDHARRGVNGVRHPAQLGSPIAYSLAEPYGKPCFVVNPPDTDELTLCARLTGIKDVYRHVHLHALNLKETAIRHSASQGRRYEDCRYIVCHIGGGISISAHDHGKMIDGFDIVGGEGPMAPTRCGAVPIAELLELFRQSGEEAIRPLLTKTGGFVSHLGISDAKRVSQWAAEGDARSKLVWDTMLYQIIRCIGAMAGVLHGNLIFPHNTGNYELAFKTGLLDVGTFNPLKTNNPNLSLTENRFGLFVPCYKYLYKTPTDTVYQIIPTSSTFLQDAPQIDGTFPQTDKQPTGLFVVAAMRQPTFRVPHDTKIPGHSTKNVPEPGASVLIGLFKKAAFP